jgi:hypothetical protein
MHSGKKKTLPAKATEKKQNQNYGSKVFYSKHPKALVDNLSDVSKG